MATGDRARPRRDDADDLPAGVGSGEQLTHGTFEDYCRERWGWSDRRARQIMGATQTVALLETGTTVPKSEWQAHELVPLMREAPEQVAEAWQEAPPQLGRQQLLHELMDPRDPDGWLSVFESVRGRHDSWRP